MEIQIIEMDHVIRIKYKDNEEEAEILEVLEQLPGERKFLRYTG